MVDISNAELAHAFKLAEIPDDTFDQIIEERKAEGDLSQLAVLRRIDETVAATKTTIGTDGKQYSKTSATATVKPRRQPLPDAVRAAGWELRKAAERLQRLHEDDRWNGHADHLADLLRSQLEFTVEVCDSLLGSAGRG